jgi:hypothetical protein
MSVERDKIVCVPPSLTETCGWLSDAQSSVNRDADFLWDSLDSAAGRIMH